MSDKTGWLEYWVDPQSWQFRGDFEGMYRDFPDPWECSKNVSELRRDIALALLFRTRRFTSILDLGCGLGAFTERLRRASSGAEILGCDISPTAVSRAREQFPECAFEVLDVTRDALPKRDAPWDLILVSELLWYVLPQLPALLTAIAGALADSGVLFIQQFYPEQQKFGLEYLRSPADLYTRYLVPAGFRRENEFLEVLGDGQVQLISLTRSV